eukprot:1132260-Rhodomonas_salina.1
MTLSELLQHTQPPDPARQLVDSRAPEWSSVSEQLAAVLATNLEHQVALARFQLRKGDKVGTIASMSDEHLGTLLVGSAVTLT